MIVKLPIPFVKKYLSFFCLSNILFFEFFVFINLLFFCPVGRAYNIPIVSFA